MVYSKELRFAAHLLLAANSKAARNAKDEDVEVEKCGKSNAVLWQRRDLM